MKPFMYWVKKNTALCPCKRITGMGHKISTLILKHLGLIILFYKSKPIALFQQTYPSTSLCLMRNLKLKRTPSVAFFCK